MNNKKSKAPSQNGEHTKDVGVTAMGLATLAVLINPKSSVFAEYDDATTDHPTTEPVTATDEVIRKAMHLYFKAGRELAKIAKMTEIDIAIHYRCMDSIVELAQAQRAKWKVNAVWHYPRLPTDDQKNRRGEIEIEGDPLRKALAAAGLPHKDSTEQILRSFCEHFYGNGAALFEGWKNERRDMDGDKERYAIWAHELPKYIASNGTGKRRSDASAGHHSKSIGTRWIGFASTPVSMATKFWPSIKMAACSCRTVLTMKDRP